MSSLHYKKIIFLITGFCGLFFGVASVEAGTLVRPPNNLGLIGYWSFNEGTSTVATDSSGTGNHGTLISMAAPATANSGWTASGKLAGGLNFDGTGDYVRVKTGVIAATEATSTVSLWFRTSASSIGGGYPIYGERGSSGNDIYKLDYGDGSSVAEPFFTWRNDAGSVMQVRPSTVGGYNDNKWHHFLVTISGTAIQMYIDGVFSGSNTIGDKNFTDPGLESRIGADTTAHFPGSIDEVRIYNRALSAAQVSALYNSGATKFGGSNTLTQGGLNNGLVGHWTFDGKDTDWRTNTTRDVSGQNNTGTLVGLPTSTAPVPGKFGQALNFATSTANYVQLASTSATSINSDFTLSAWVYPTNSDCCQGIIAKGSTYGNVGQYRLLTGYAGLSNAYLRLDVSDGTTMVNVAAFPGASATTPNMWHHVACNTDTTTMNCFWDGNFMASSSRESIGSSFTGDTWFALGTLNPNQMYYGGRIDDVRIYNRVLSSSEIKQLHNIGQGTANSSSTALTKGTSLASELSVHWTFDGRDTNTTITDVSGAGRNGWFTGGATSSAKTIGKSGQGFTFDGSNDYVATVFDPPNTSQTMSVWVKTPSTGAMKSILGFTTALPTSGTHDRQLYINADGTVRYRIYSGGDNLVTSTATITDNAWHLVTARYETGVGISIFVDGVQQGAVVSTGAPYDYVVTTYLAVGIESLNSAYWNGQMDDVRFYSKALSNTEILQLYKVGQ